MADSYVLLLRLIAPLLMLSLKLNISLVPYLGVFFLQFIQFSCYLNNSQTHFCILCNSFRMKTVQLVVVQLYCLMITVSLYKKMYTLY